jgi:hypothetical protein
MQSIFVPRAQVLFDVFANIDGRLGLGLVERFVRDASLQTRSVQVLR